MRIVRNLNKINSYQDEGAVPYVFIECMQTIYPVDGHGVTVTHGNSIDFDVPDMYGRPWAEIWEKNFEQDMEKDEEEEDIFSFD